jgi:hypothetical protein
MDSSSFDVGLGFFGRNKNINVFEIRGLGGQSRGMEPDAGMKSGFFF